MNVLLLASHAVAEFDDVRMFSDMGLDVFAPGGYAEPANPGEDMRPPLPDAADHPEFRALCQVQRERHAPEGDEWAIDWAKADVHPDIIEWADVVIVHHFVERWIPPILGKAKRVIWRTCGQSNPELERYMAQGRPLGLEIVRYSPAEQRAYGADFAGQDALIRFGKYPDDYGPWTGEWVVVGNVSQWKGSDGPLGRGNALHLDFWRAATEGLATLPAGPGSEALDGFGRLTYPTMLSYLRKVRCYLYTGTEPASYTLGLIEAMMTGTPVVSMPAERFGWPDLFEGAEITELSGHSPADCRELLEILLGDQAKANGEGQRQRERAIDLFGIETIAAQWTDYLGC